MNRCNSLRQEPSTPTSWGDDGDDGVDDNGDGDVDDDDDDDDDDGVDDDDNDDVDDDEGTALSTPTHFGRSQCMWPV